MDRQEVVLMWRGPVNLENGLAAVANSDPYSALSATGSLSTDSSKKSANTGVSTFVLVL